MDARRQADQEQHELLELKAIIGSSMIPVATPGALREEEVAGLPNPWRRLAWVVAAVGFVATVGWLVVASMEQADYVESFVRVPASVGEPVEIPDAGIHTVWATYADGSALDFRPRTSLSLEGPAGGEAVDVDLIGAETTVTYSLDGAQRGVGVGTVDIPEPGTYYVVRHGVALDDVVLSLGEGVGMPFPILRPALVIGAVSVAVLALVLAMAWRLNLRRADDVSDRVAK